MSLRSNEESLVPKAANEAYNVYHCGNCLQGERAGPYAAVILAAPLEQSNLSKAGFEMPFIPKRHYQTTVTTLVRGSLRASYFELAKAPDGSHLCLQEFAASASQFTDGLSASHLQMIGVSGDVS